MKKSIFFLTTVAVLLSINLYGQDNSQSAKTYFAKYLSTASMKELTLKSLPTLEDCKLVYKEKSANEFYEALADLKSAMASAEQKENEAYADVKIDVFSTQDIESGKGNYADGMKNVLDRLQPYVLFYEVTLLKKKGDEFGKSYKYWVNINGRWVYFAKPFKFFQD